MTFRHDSAEPHDVGNADKVDAGNANADADAAEVDDADQAGSLADVGRASEPADSGSAVGGPAGTTGSGVEAAVVGDQPDNAPDSQSRNPL